MSKQTITIPSEKLALCDELIEDHPEIERKGKTTPYTSLNGHMFSFLTRDGSMGLRLANDDRAEFLIKYDSQLMEQYGRVMKGYVVIPDELLADTKTLHIYL